MPIPEQFLRRPITIQPGASAREAARKMDAEHVGSLVVVDGERPIGIATDRDIALAVLAERRDPDVFPVSACMSRPVVTLLATRSLTDASHTMRRTGVRRLPLVDRQGRLVGFLSSDDMVRLIGHELEALSKAVQKGFALEADPARAATSVFGRE